MHVADPAQIKRQGMLTASDFDLWKLTFRRVSERDKPRAAPSFSFVGVHRKARVIVPSRMHHVIRASTNRAIVPSVEEIEDERCIHRDCGMQGSRLLPGAISYARPRFSPQRGAQSTAAAESSAG